MVGTKAQSTPASQKPVKVMKKKSEVKKLTYQTPKDFARARLRMSIARKGSLITKKRKSELAEKEKRMHHMPRSFPTQSKKRKVCLFKQFFKPKTHKLRSSITPGTVLIILVGRLRGRRVVFLKQLPSGLLLVTGPYKFNGVPIRRVNHSYVIATKTKIDVSKVNLPDVMDREKEIKYFGRVKEEKSKRKSDNIFASKKVEYKPNDQRKADQKRVDKEVMSCIQAHPKAKLLRGYLKTLFSLGKRDYPHKMVF